jgi:hypothetical protein
MRRQVLIKYRCGSMLQGQAIWYCWHGTGDGAAGQAIASVPTFGTFVSASGMLFCSTLPRNCGLFAAPASHSRETTTESVLMNDAIGHRDWQADTHLRCRYRRKIVLMIG